MVKDKGFVILDPTKDGKYFKTLLHIFNDLQKQQTVEFPYNGQKGKQKWILTSRKIGCMCKELIDIKPPLFWGTSTSRPHNKGFINMPPDVELKIIPFRGKQKIIFSRKIF